MKEDVMFPDIERFKENPVSISVAYDLSRFDILLPSWTKNRMCKERVVNGKV
jgi:hypothetical protein